ncbi:transcription initiation factor TFIID subunit 2 [Strongylocentrotus purpuratus]|uniref:Transcription initiation factor TFIID subunit 2 n=1 Tax=Strongylocentrotus purpuratus TaxID=7668 RepID=A0A7M7NMY0_STRPU|nr:transcription initiation factor TFIID subunit 2 [Strongylocentrotus purpuratus]XP_030839038.1 transcription initiation factor TFIID subunit 2 [Strongylocentrotus purpuratus]
MSKNARKPDKSYETSRAFRLSHQILCITAINFNRRSIVGFTELHLLPLRAGVNRIKLNCKQCMVYRVVINDQWDVTKTISYNDPTLSICQQEMKQRNLVFFSNRHKEAVASVSSDRGYGELIVKIPKSAMNLVNDYKTLRLSIEFSLENPSGGIHFVVPDAEDTMAERAAHMFTYSLENSSRLWFPCVDSYSEPCTWKLEFTVDSDMMAVSSGELIETVYTPDMTKKTYHYILNVPTSASNIALAVGPFEVVVDPTMHEITHFCLPKLKPLLQHSTVFFHEVIEFYEETVGTSFPYTCYKQVFVDEAYDDSQAYASMAIFSTNLLHSARIIDQTFETRRLLAEALASQFFGCYICPETWADAWLTKGITKYLAGLCLRKMFGTNEYRSQIYSELTELCKYEQETGGVVLHPYPMEEPSTGSKSSGGDAGADSATPSFKSAQSSSLGKTTKPSVWGGNLHFPCTQPHTVSWRHWKMIMMKSHLIMRLIEIRVGQELLLKVFNKLLSLATSASHQKFMSCAWSNMLISTSGFLKSISTVSGKDLKLFINRWVCQGGMAQFRGTFHFNRKRNIVELELRQDPGRPGIIKYVGPLKVTIQELDGSFEHTLQVEDNLTKGEITCHSKSRRHKKKKIPLKNGEEVDMDLSKMDPDSPVLWIRVDTEMTLLREVIFDQPDYQWQCQLRYERDVVAQLEAVECLKKFASLETTHALSDIILHSGCYYKVRTQAAYCYAQVSNELAETFSGHTALIAMFKKLFSSFSSEDIVRRNNFMDFRAYLIQKAVPQAIGLIRNIHTMCPRESLAFLVDLIKYNDNAKNKFSDCYYRAGLIDALSNTITPAVSMVNTSVENLSPETKMVLEEVTRCLNLEKLLPCYQHTVTISCLRNIRLLQKNSHLPSEPTLFQAYAQYGNFTKVRLAALEALVDYVKVEASADIFSWLLDIVEQDPVPIIKHKLLRLLIANPPFKYKEQSKLSTEELVERLWAHMNSGTSHDARLRCDVVDFFFALYGKTRPSCLPLPELGFVVNLKERTTSVNPNIMPDEPDDDDDDMDSDGQEDSFVEMESMSDPLGGALSLSPGVSSPRISKRESSSPIHVDVEEEDDLPVFPTKRERLDSEEADIPPFTPDFGKVKDEVKQEVKEESPLSPLEPGEVDDSSRDSFSGVTKETTFPGSPSSSSHASLQRDDSRSSLFSDPGKAYHHHQKKKKKSKDKHRHKHRHERPEKELQRSTTL